MQRCHGVLLVYVLYIFLNYIKFKFSDLLSLCCIYFDDIIYFFLNSYRAARATS